MVPLFRRQGGVSILRIRQTEYNYSPKHFLSCSFFTCPSEGAYNELSVLLLQGLVAFTELVGHQLVLIPLLLAGVQLFGQNQESFFFTLQLTLTNQELHGRTNRIQN